MGNEKSYCCGAEPMPIHTSDMNCYIGCMNCKKPFVSEDEKSCPTCHADLPPKTKS